LYDLCNFVAQKIEKKIISPYHACLSVGSSVDTVFQLFSLEIYLNFNAIKLPQHLHAECAHPRILHFLSRQRQSRNHF